ncbi:T9SS type A sorting domain-containing protein [Bacteroidales bacterium]|nr:T9SS type A sorting domain-containing protein [Bacteroidales bacterium]
MKNIKFFYLAVILLMAITKIYAQDVSVNLNMKHSVNSVSEFDRSKFFIVHHSIDDSDWDSDAQRKSFLEDNDVYMGRSTGGITWHFSQTAQDPLKTGWPSITDIQSRGKDSRDDYAAETSAHELEDRVSPMVIGGQPLTMYPNGQLTSKGWAYAGYGAVAEFYAHYFKEFYGNGGVTGAKKPKYLEVFNEPFVKASTLGTTAANISKLHNVVAQRVKELHPDVMVGGFGAAHPAYQSNNFGHWNSRWKTFIDTAGANMDFFSYHLYDNHKEKAVSEIKRKGSNIEAIMDMVEHYSVLKLGQRKPIYITEFGYFLQEVVYYNKQSDWKQLRSYNSMVMQFMERQDVIIGTIPFMILKAEWGRSEDGIPYGPRLMRQKKEVPGYEGNGEDWVYTDLVKYYQFWKDLKGIRAESRSNDPDILTDVYVDGNKAYVLINNLSVYDRVLELGIFENQGLELTKVSVSHLYANDNDEAVWDKFDLVDTSKITLGQEATMILTYEYDGDIVQNQTSEESKYFADAYLQAIQANTPIMVNINGVTKATIGEAVLRIGMGRNHGLSLTPTIAVNGTNITVPTDWRGDSQSTRSEFFGVLEVPVPYSLIKENNEVSISFPDNGGHVSSISMQHYNQSVEPNKPLNIDDDEDGVINENDNCPDTKPGTIVNETGCSVDVDNDGVLNENDSCPNTIPGALVNEKGCSIDDDGDSIVNALDICPNTVPGAMVDDKGCVLDGYFINIFAKDKSTGDPLDNAEVIIDGDTLKSNSLGKVNFRLLAGTHSVVVNHPYYIGADTIEIFGTDDKDVLITKTFVDLRINLEKDGSRFKNASINIGDITQVTNRLGYTTFYRLKIDSTYAYIISEGGEILKDDDITITDNGEIDISIETTGLKAATSNSQLTLFPNPVQTELHIKGLNRQVEYTIFNMLNAKIQQGSTQANKVNIRELKNGIYFIRIENELLQFVKK